MSAILVLDDQAADRALLATVLGHAGHAVVEAATGEQALRMARADPPELIMVDLMMPGMNGYEFMRELRADPTVSHTRVVWCTAAYDENEVRRIADSCGVSHILVKPCAPGAIVAMIQSALRSNGHVAPRIVAAEFDREQLRVVNAKLVQALAALETRNGELREAQRQTDESLTLLQTLQSAAPVAFGFVDRDFRIRQMNEQLAAINGTPIEEQLGRRVAEIAPELWPTLEPIYRHVIDTGEAVINQDVEGQSPSTPGQARHWLSSYYPVRLKDEVIGIGLVLVDITERQEAEEFRAVVMENLAEGLYVMDEEGRLVFMNAAASKMLGWSEYELRGESAHRAIHYQHPDGSPFAEGDCQLSRVRTDGRTVRMVNDAFTRKDGSIFPVAYSAGPLRSGADVRGVVVAFRDTTDEQTERSRAQRELDALTWVGRIRDALDDDRLVLYSQPIVPLSKDAEHREELLVRMIGQKGEIILPGSFLPVAEKYGQVREIDEWVITQTARVAAGGALVHANLSVDSIVSVDLLPRIERALTAAGADPTNVVFEITETALMADMEAGDAFAQGITDIGCGLALDDFGTGYGSFTYLQRMQIKYLKIDIVFVRDLVSNTTNQHIVKAIVNIARGFNQNTIAEGVEDADTLELLRDLGVDFAQGYHVGRPQPRVSR
jgi:PAS domain S-box-containing protein